MSMCLMRSTDKSIYVYWKTDLAQRWQRTIGKYPLIKKNIFVSVPNLEPKFPIPYVMMFFEFNDLR